MRKKTNSNLKKERRVQSYSKNDSFCVKKS